MDVVLSDVVVDSDPAGSTGVDVGVEGAAEVVVVSEASAVASIVSVPPHAVNAKNSKKARRIYAEPL